MITRDKTVVFVWRCPSCSVVYDREGLQFLYADEGYRYCTCGERLVEDVEQETEHHYRLVISENMRGTRLHRELVRREAGEDVEVAVGGWGRCVAISCCAE